MSTRAVVASLFTAVIGQIAAIVAGVIAARMLGVEDRGWLALLALFPLLLSQAGSLGLPLALSYAVAAQGAHPRRALRTIAFPAALQLGALVLVNLVIVTGLAASAPVRVADVAAWSLLGVPAALAQAYGLAVLQGSRRFAALNAFRLMPGLLYAAGTVLLLLLVGRGSIGDVLAVWALTYLGVGMSTLCAALLGRSASVGDTVPTGPLALLRFGLRGWPSSIAPIENFRVEQLAVGVLVSPAALGLYVVASAFANLPRLFAQSIGMIAYPDIAKAPVAGRQQLLLRYMAAAFLVCGSTMALLEYLLPWLVPYFFGEEFLGAVPVARVLLLAAFLFGLRRVLSGAVAGGGRPGDTAISELSAWITLAGTLPLSLRWGAVGVALSVALASAVSLITLVVLVLRASRANRGPDTERGTSVEPTQG